MKVITEDKLVLARNALIKKGNNLGACVIDSLISDCLREIDTLTVSKLRPMREAPKDGQWFLGYYEGSLCEYFERLKYSAIGELRSSDDEFEEEDIIGWIPMPIYKPEVE